MTDAFRFVVGLCGCVLIVGGLMLCWKVFLGFLSLAVGAVALASVWNDT